MSTDRTQTRGDGENRKAGHRIQEGEPPRRRVASTPHPHAYRFTRLFYFPFGSPWLLVPRRALERVPI